jgi:hypothetical protein
MMGTRVLALPCTREIVESGVASGARPLSAQLLPSGANPRPARPPHLRATLAAAPPPATTPGPDPSLPARRARLQGREPPELG